MLNLGCVRKFKLATYGLIMCVRWGGSVSSKCTVSNGVRQGGILSPFLFNVYMDDLSVNLKKCPTGCIAGGRPLYSCEPFNVC